jgi:hypothetical protein
LPEKKEKSRIYLLVLDLIEWQGWFFCTVLEIKPRASLIHARCVLYNRAIHSLFLGRIFFFFGGGGFGVLGFELRASCAC